MTTKIVFQPEHRKEQTPKGTKLYEELVAVLEKRRKPDVDEQEVIDILNELIRIQRIQLQQVEGAVEAFHDKDKLAAWLAGEDLDCPDNKRWFFDYTIRLRKRMYKQIGPGQPGPFANLPSIDPDNLPKKGS